MAIEQKLQENILALSRDDDRNKPGVFHVTELVLCSARSYFYRALGRQVRPNGRMLAGSLVHEKLPILLKDIKEFDRATLFEQECKKEFAAFTIRGHADTVTENAVYEFKFTASDMGKYGCPMHWSLQANAYATMLGKKEWNVVTIDSQSLKVAVVSGVQSSMGFDVLFDRAAEIYKGLQDEKVPEGPTGPWECERYSWKDKQTISCEFSMDCPYYTGRKKK